MTRKVFSTALAIAFAVCFLNTTMARAFTVSAAEFPNSQQVNFGDLGVVNGIRGDIERTIQFEVVPGEEFTFDLTLVNLVNETNDAHVVLVIDLPNDSRMTLMEEDITLEAHERLVNNFSHFIPDNLQLYGRYTTKLFINDRLADWFQFDMNDRGGILVRWDDGVLANAWAFYNAGDKWAIRGCMPGGAIIDEVGVHVLAENDMLWPWPNSIHEAIEIHVYDDTGAGGLPGNLVFNSGPVTSGPSGDVTAAAGIAAPPNAFYVANHQLTDFDRCEGMGVDVAVDHYDQMYQEVGGVWSNTWTSGDYMIWAVGHVGSQSVTIGNPPAR
jgi:hypothetical protein